jgi:hypothetical protein
VVGNVKLMVPADVGFAPPWGNMGCVLWISGFGVGAILTWLFLTELRRIEKEAKAAG